MEVFCFWKISDFMREKKKNDSELSKQLADLCDVYVNDAFGTSHRKHASTYGVAQYAKEKVAGLLLKKEIDFFWDCFI